MASHVQFNRIVDGPYKRRTDRLRRILYPKTGKTPLSAKSIVNRD
jgi:hypothetical protein